MRSLLLAALLPVPLLLGGCGDSVSCQSACQRAFQSGECNIRVPGQTQDRLVRDCIRECEGALRRTGDVGNYDPNDRNSIDRSEPFSLQNEKQAALWIDCVLESSCPRLNDGFCPGGGIN